MRNPFFHLLTGPVRRWGDTYVACRRRRNFASSRKTARLAWRGQGKGLLALFVVILVAGALTLAWHAREVSDAVGGRAGQSPFALDALQALMPGEGIDVPSAPGVHVRMT